MLKKELLERSPLRVFDQSAHGGLLPGHMGMFASEKGVGKTACLVHVATDQMLLGKNVVHISFADTTAHVSQWYEDIYDEISREYKLAQAREIRDELASKRVVMKFENGAADIAHVAKTVATLRDSTGFSPGTLMVDGFDFSADNQGQIHEIHRFAGDIGASVWFSATLPALRGSLVDGKLPAPVDQCQDDFDVMVHLEQAAGRVMLRIIKDYDAPIPPDMVLALDPSTLLIQKKS